MEIQLDNRQTRIGIDPVSLKKKAARLLGDLGCDEPTVLSISVVDASEMAELNSRYRNKEGPTNVLAFPQNPGTADGPGVHLLGDVVICGDRVAIDAEELGYTQQDMLLYLLIHGALHLMGHQHDKADRADAMARRVEQLFATLREHPEPDSVSRGS